MQPGCLGLSISLGLVCSRLLVLTALWLGSVFSVSTRAATPDENAFTADVAQLISSALPEANVSIKAPLTLVISTPGEDESGAGWQVSLDRIWSYCGRNSSDCQRSIASYVSRTAQIKRQQTLPIERQKIMAVIRSEKYVQGLRDEVPSEPLAEHIMGGIWLVCVVDGEVATRVLGERDLPKAGLSKTEVIELVHTNLAAYLPPIRQSLNASPDGAFGVVGGDAYYAASRLLLHEQWSDLAKGVKGKLLVTVPDTGVIIFADSAKPQAVQALLKASYDAAKNSERPISPAILAWTPQGWEEWKR